MDKQPQQPQSPLSPLTPDTPLYIPPKNFNDYLANYPDQQCSSPSLDQVVKSLPSNFAQQSLSRGPQYYTYHTEQDFNQLQWSDGSIYAFGEMLGSGKYSLVFGGVNLNNGDECVVKILKPTKRKKIVREIKILTTLQPHPNITTLTDIVQQHQIPCLIFHKQPTMDPIQFIFDCNPLACKYYLFQVLQGLHYTHSMGIMHRDVKPENLLIDPVAGRVRIIDWGLADFYLPYKSYHCHVCTTYFKAPEILVGYSYYHYSLDVWSFGTVLASAIFKKQPFFQGQNNAHQLQQINKILGTSGLQSYLKKYNIGLQPHQKHHLTSQPGLKLSELTTEYNKQFATPQALDLLQKILIYDHNLRPTAWDCMQHRYFDQVREGLMKRNQMEMGGRGDGWGKVKQQV